MTVDFEAPAFWTLVACATMALAATQAAYGPPFKSWVRLNEGRPILSPRGAGFEAAGTFNPAVIRAGNRYVMLYRAQDSKGSHGLDMPAVRTA